MTPQDRRSPTAFGPEQGSTAAVSWSGCTHLGRFRPNNEDAFLMHTFDGREVHHLGKVGEAPLATADFVFAVSDGMGGARSGEFASRFAADRITRLFYRSFRLSPDRMEQGYAEILTELFTSIHVDLLKLGYSYPECAGMGTTLSLCWFSRTRAYFGHIGDSRIYHLPATGPLVQVTHDHSHVGWLRRKGEINEREARMHPRRNALEQALGAGHQFVEPQIGVLEWRPGDRFLVCSDGVVDGLWDRRIEELLRNFPAGDGKANLAEQVVNEAVSESGRDNATAVVIEVQDCGAPPCA